MLRNHLVLSTCLLVGLLGVPTFVTADVTVGGNRPVVVRVPADHDPEIPTPLLIELHPFGPFFSPQVQFSFWDLTSLAEEEGLLLALPTGMQTASGSYFWDATDACCGDRSVDDSTYLRRLIEEIVGTEELNVDPDRIYVVGQSNGGFMAHRLACDHADLIAAVVAKAGVPWNDAALCAPASPVHVLQISGTADTSVPFDGGTLNNVTIPGAVETVQRWAALNGCSLEPEFDGPIDLDAGPPPGFAPPRVTGAETTVTRYRAGCNPGGSVELWALQEGQHLSGAGPVAGRHILDYLLAHPKRPAPVASFTATPREGFGPLEVAFDANSSTSPDGTEIGRHVWNFGDGTRAEGVRVQHTYTTPGDHVASLTVITADERVSRPLGLEITVIFPKFRRGDCNDDGTVDIADPLAMLFAIFLDQFELTCDDACDSNDDGAVDISDAITTLEVLFLGAGVIPPPGMMPCGVDPTDDQIGCDTFEMCG